MERLGKARRPGPRAWRCRARRSWGGRKGRASYLVLLLILAMLLAQCDLGGGKTPGPGDEIRAVEAQQERALADLRRETDRERFRAVVSDGQVRALMLEHELKVRPLDSAPAVDRTVAAFVQGQKQLLRIDERQGELRLARTAGEELRVYHYEQFVDGVPVYGSSVTVVVDRQGRPASQVKAVFGSYVPDLSAERFGIPALGEPYTRISSSEALEILGRHEGAGASGLTVLRSEGLTVYDQALFQPRCPSCKPVAHDPRLCWHLLFSSVEYGGVVVDAFVDAMDGTVVHVQPRAYEERDINVYDFGNQNQQLYDNSTTCLVASCPGEALTCFNAAEITYDYYETVFGRESYDGNGTQVEIYVLNPDFDGAPGNCNARYRSTPFGLDSFEFETGTPSLDSFAHEYTHGVHWWISKPVYQNESGAMAEHIADAFAILIGHWSGADTDWRMTPGAPACGGSWRTLDPVPTDRDEYADYWVTTADNGGVHRNSEILNKAFFLMANGDTFNGITVKPVDEDKLADIYMLAMQVFLGPNTTFEEFAFDITQASRMMFPTDYAGVTCRIRNAFAAIGLDGYGILDVDGSDLDCDDKPAWQDPDDDGDGVFDVDDNCPEEANASQADADSDGLGNACDDDDDGDGIRDGIDNCPLVHNPAGQADDFDGDRVGDDCEDTDGDGILDAADNCPGDSNYAQVDWDLDGLGNECDSDMDGDGIPNGVDSCPWIPGPADDTDGDGVGDVCDKCPGVPDPGQEDADGDWVGDACDLCMFEPNAQQEDGDGDGVPDACDTCADLVDPDQADRDEDHVGDPCDNCPDTANRGQHDCDGDGLGDACDEGDCDGDGIADRDDNCPFVSNPGQEDGNGNGIGDWCDPLYQGLEADVPGLERSPFDPDEFTQFFEPDFFREKGIIPEVRFGPICLTCPDDPESVLPAEIVVEAIPWGTEVVVLDRMGQRVTTSEMVSRDPLRPEGAREAVHLKAYLQPHQEYRVVFVQERDVSPAEALENTRDVRPKLTLRLLEE